jgi:hypothetical protein
VKEPEHDPSLVTAAAQAGKGGKGGEDRLQKKLRELTRRQKGSTARAAAPSADGKGVML